MNEPLVALKNFTQRGEWHDDKRLKTEILCNYPTHFAHSINTPSNERGHRECREVQRTQGPHLAALPETVATTTNFKPFNNNFLYQVNYLVIHDTRD